MKQRGLDQGRDQGQVNNTALSTAQQSTKTKGVKAKKGKDNTLVPNGANVVNPASSSAPVKTKKLNDTEEKPQMPKKG